MAAADTMVLLRSAVRQAARRQGYLLSFMCRPNFPNVLASGWHLHQSLVDPTLASQRFRLARQARGALVDRPRVPGRPARQCALRPPPFSDTDAQRLQALPRHQLDGADPGDLGGATIAASWCASWALPAIRSTHLENRVGEPLANPYLYMASQIHAGLDGIARKLSPGRSADAPYELSAEPLPKTLGEALDALRTNQCFRAGFGDAFVDYFIAIKSAEIAYERGPRRAIRRIRRPTGRHKEYFDLA